jgi:hypothetical protein
MDLSMKLLRPFFSQHYQNLFRAAEQIYSVNIQAIQPALQMTDGSFFALPKICETKGSRIKTQFVKRLSSMAKYFGKENYNYLVRPNCVPCDLQFQSQTDVCLYKYNTFSEPIDGKRF